MPLVSITVKAYEVLHQNSTADIANSASFPYILAIKEGTNEYLSIYVSQYEWHIADLYYNSTKKGQAIATGSIGSQSTGNQYASYAIENVALSVNGNLIIPADGSLYYSSGGLASNRVYVNILNATYNYSNRYNSPIVIYNGNPASILSSLTSLKIWTNSNWSSAEKALVGSFSNDLESIGITSGITEAQVNQLIQNQLNTTLNSTTSVTTQANNIQTQITNNYISYSNGEIDLATLQANIDSLAQQLENLNNSSGATISDKIAINNAITQTQLVQDAANKDAIIQEMEEDLTVSSSTSSVITGKINEANQVFNQYDTGDITQSEAVTQINQYITYLTQLITPETPTADIEAINAGVNTINGIKDSITSHSDLDDTVSDEAQRSDQEEKEYLEDITSETTDNINSLKSKVDSSISESQANEVKEQVITPLLQNTLIIKVLPIAALFMVLAVTLGFKYKL